MPKSLTLLISLLLVLFNADTVTAKAALGQKLVPHRISLANGKSFDLNLPEGFDISVAAQGLKRVRFMAKSPDNRVFVTDMYNLTDNKRGVVYILDDFDPARKQFRKVIPYLTGLRNPNSVAFYTDQQQVNWFYLALTDRLLRYRYQEGELKPSGEPDVLATFPDYGLSYKYGGWHLTRTIVVGGNGKIYVSVGSSCNACEEKEEVRASILEMDPDGKNQKHFARGLRNAVGLRWTQDKLFATNMGSDHLGDHKPADTMYQVKEGVNYGWPYCFQSGPRRFPDPKFNSGGKKMNCRTVPSAYAAFDAHSSPLGLEYFDSSSVAELKDSFLVALHGSTKRNLNRGYRVVLIPGTARRSLDPEDFINGFLEGRVVHGRPADVLRFGIEGFLLTDDHAGVVYYVFKK
ncbi:MAG: PQQ-dependent sugar dehydrogenase [Pyrinomonadaceae bacterium]|nr:PQQ-dependent sugar dehydrogenase [Pyrinomonadaceae bacterium]